MNTPSSRPGRLLVLGSLLVLSGTGCRERPPAPDPDPPADPLPPSTAVGVGTQAASSGVAAEAVPNRPPQKPADPLKGQFGLEEATAGLVGEGELHAELHTDAGQLTCRLYSDRAPITVANFVGLARGLRPFLDPKTKEWVKRPAYDDGVFHRIIKGFMIQGGDPTGTGKGEPGYVFADENWEGATHDRRGLLCMANRGRNTNGMQFFIMDGSATRLDGSYTIFGECSPDAVIEKLAASEVRGDRAVNPPRIKKVLVTRRPARKP